MSGGLIRKARRAVLIAGATPVLVVLGTVSALTGPTTGAPAGTRSGGSAALGVGDIGAVAGAAGFRGAGLAMAIAVALAESGGNPTATDYDSNGSVDRGVWQINSVHTQYSPACDYDPSCAAAAAYDLSDSGRQWAAWVTYQHGAEIAFLPQAVAWVDAQGPQT